MHTVLADGGFQHGHTSAGNPMACAVGDKIIDIMLEEKLSENAAAMGELLGAGLRNSASSSNAWATSAAWACSGPWNSWRTGRPRSRSRPIGTWGAIIKAEAFDEGLIVYPRRPINGLKGEHILIAPPLIITEEQVGELLEKLEKALARLQKKVNSLS